MYGMKKSGIILAVLLIGGMLVFGNLNRTPQYHVDYSGDKAWYEGAKDSYPAGAEVTLYFDMIATDTKYTFLLDGEPIRVDCENEKFVIRFTMPEHDVTLSCRTQNIMEYVP